MSILISEKNLTLVLITAIILFPWIFLVFQGLDILEFGLWVTGYENFFKNPEVMPPVVIASWLTAFIGASVDSLFRDFGVIGYKIVYIFLLYILLYIIFLLLSTFTTKKLLLFFLLLAEVFVNIDPCVVSYYYLLTTLLFLIGLFFLYKGLTTNRLFLLFIGGAIIGMNIFVRLPNILGIFLFLIIIYYDISIGILQYRKIFKKIVVFILGYLFAIVSILFFMKMIGHYDLYVSNISFLLGLTGDSSPDHGIRGLVGLVFREHYYAIKYGALLFIIFISLLLSEKYWIYNKLNIFSIVFSSILLSFLMIYLSNINTLNYYGVYSGITGLIYGCLLWIAYKKFKEYPEFSTIAFSSFLLMELIPLGSAAYQYHTVEGMYLAIPVIMIYLYSLRKISYRHFNVSKKGVHAFRAIITITIIVFSMIIINYYRAPDGEIKRWQMFYSIDHPRLIGVFVTKERAETLNELITALNKYQKNFSYILTYEQISTVAYLSNLPPYINTTYPFFWSSNKVEKELKLASLQKTLPIVVRAKSNTTLKGWPKKYKLIDRKKNERNRVRVVLERFLKQNRYLIIWKNKNFEILIPQKITRNKD